MDLSIIIVNWNTRELLAGCLGSVVGWRLSVSSYGDGFEGLVEQGVGVEVPGELGEVKLLAVRLLWKLGANLEPLARLE